MLNRWSQLRSLGRRIVRRRERGAAVVEYALIVGLLVLATTAAISSLEDDAENYFDETSNDIGDLPQYAIPTLTLPDGTPITTTTQTPTTTTTVAPTTTAGPTTTTAGPTTTAPIATTTTAPPVVTAIAQLLDRSIADSATTWRARFRVTLTNSDTGDRVPGATVSSSFQGYGNRQCVTDSNGRCNMSWIIPDSVANVLASVTDVVAVPNWDGSGASISLIKP
jgi:Flp pilus assembly pilin Flp